MLLMSSVGQMSNGMQLTITITDGQRNGAVYTHAKIMASSATPAIIEVANGMMGSMSTSPRMVIVNTWTVRLDGAKVGSDSFICEAPCAMRTFIASIPALLWFLSQIMIVGVNSYIEQSDQYHTVYGTGRFGKAKSGWLYIGCPRH